MTSRPRTLPETLTSLRALRELAGALWDAACLFLSPFALILFLVAGVIGMDYFGQHVAFLRELAEHGLEAEGTIAAYDPGDTSFIVLFNTPQNGVDSAFLYTKYYSAAILQTIRNGRQVRVRYLNDSRAILVDAYREVRGYTGFLQGLQWLLLACLVVLITRPEILFMGLKVPENFFKINFDAPPTPRTPGATRKSP